MQESCTIYESKKIGKFGCQEFTKMWNVGNPEALSDKY